VIKRRTRLGDGVSGASRTFQEKLLVVLQLLRYSPRCAC
jgi:hypothetical protein